MKKWWQSKKVWGTVLAVATLVVGAREGWDPEVTHSIAYCFMGGVTVEGVIDALSAYSKKGS